MANGRSEGDIQIEQPSTTAAVAPTLRSGTIARENNRPLPERPRSLYDPDYQNSINGGGASQRTIGGRRSNQRYTPEVQFY